jgi:xanthine dehydrogenase accessory factor
VVANEKTPEGKAEPQSLFEILTCESLIGETHVCEIDHYLGQVIVALCRARSGRTIRLPCSFAPYPRRLRNVIEPPGTAEYDYLRRVVAMDFYAKAAEFAAQRRPFAIATVVRVEGSSSARRGSKALIDSDGRIVMGWVGGGCAESAVRSEALKCVRSERPHLITLDMQDEVLGVGMPCGGVMDVYIEPVLPQPELIIAGHGRIAETLAQLGHLMNFSVTVHDPQAERQNFPAAERIINRDFDVTQIAFGPGTYVVIATLHKNDHLWLQRALAGEAAYVALVASAHRSRLVLDYLLAEGLPAAKIERVWAPAGLDLAAATPEEIALSIMSQIVALRRGGSAAPRKETAHTSEAEPARAGLSDKTIRQCDTGKIE